MGIINRALILGSLLVISSSISLYSQELWNIFHAKENEQVFFFLETKQVLDTKVYREYNAELAKRLSLDSPYTLEALFVDAPSIEERERKHRFKPLYDLKKFYLLGISSKEKILQQFRSPFEFSRDLRTRSSDWMKGELAFASVEPDLPISAYPTGEALSSNKCPDREDSPKDRGWSLRNMMVKQAWENRNAKGLDIKIGHPDTGYADHVDLDNEALIIMKKNNFIEKGTYPQDPLWDMVGVKQPGHGTSTGSVIMSRGDIIDPPPENIEGGTMEPGKITGVAIEAKLIPYRSIKSVAKFTYGNVIKAIYEAVKEDDCSVISLSLGGLPSRPLKAALEYTIENNVIIVAAAGNFKKIPVVYPARYSSCIAVAATRHDDKPWGSSSHGKSVTISAPGESVWRAFRSTPNESTDKVAPSCGTSYSTANVAGVAAMWLSHHGRDGLIKQFNDDTRLQFVFKELIITTATIPDNWDQDEYGAGIINAKGLLGKKPEDARENAKAEYSKLKSTKKENVDNELNDIENTYYNMMKIQ